MSFISVSASDAAAVPLEDLHTLAKKAGFEIEPSSVDEKDYHNFHTSFTLISKSLADLPAYIDPRLAPVPTTHLRTFNHPSSTDNPLNAWSYKADIPLVAKSPTSQKLKGKKIALKANVSVARFPLDIGTSPLMFEGGEYPISTIDATVVRRLLLAGAEVVGTGTCENMSLSGISTTAHTGPVHNAWAHGYVTGGSSSGVGSLVSASDVAQSQQDKRPFLLSEDWIKHCRSNGVDCAIGGDQGGSIRLPAHYSGIYGLKPTKGLVPYTGIMSLGASIDHTGPMTRNLPDLITMLEVIAGADGIDQRQGPRVPLPENVPAYTALLAEWQQSRSLAGEWTPSTAARGLRIGVLTEGTRTHDMSPHMTAAFETAISRFTTLGATVCPVSVPMHLIAPSIWSLITRSSLVRNLRNSPPDLLSYPMPGINLRRPDQWMYEYFKRRNPAVVNALLNAAWLDSPEGVAAERKAFGLVAQLAKAYDACFETEGLDVLVLPVTKSAAGRIPEGICGGEEGTRISAAEVARDMMGVTANTCPFNLSGHPALSMPLGWIETEDGEGKLPAGLQIVGRHFGEMDVFKAAMAWEVGGKGMDSL
ncbi:hypothetical protein MBLNU457_5482t1 [Dothideomycetes sp. NU457]